MGVIKLFNRSKKSNRPDRVATLDIGSSKVSCAIAQISQNSGITILGTGQYASSGFKAGVVADMDSLVQSILQAVHAAEMMAQETIQDVYVNISSAIVQSSIVNVSMDISGHEVNDADLRNLINQAIQQSQAPSLEVIHVIPYQYKIDDSRGIKDPRGMYGDVLSARIHVVTAPLSPLRNLIACVEKAHLDVVGLIASPFASGLACLEQDEMDLGTILLDIGSHTTGIGIYSNGNLVYTDSLKVGGFHITNDLAHGLSTSLSHAERLKTLYGSAISSSRTDRENIIVPQAGDKSTGGGGAKMPKASLVRIIRPRIEEMFTLIKKRLNDIGGKRFSSYRVVITGGTAQLPGIQELGGIILNQPVRIGKPIHVVGTDSLIQSPSFSCCAGELSYLKLANKDDLTSSQSGVRLKSLIGNLSGWIGKKM